MKKFIAQSERSPKIFFSFFIDYNLTKKKPHSTGVVTAHTLLISGSSVIRSNLFFYFVEPFDSVVETFTNRSFCFISIFSSLLLKCEIISSPPHQKTSKSIKWCRWMNCRWWISFSVLLRCAIEYMFRFIESDTLDKYAHQNAKKEKLLCVRPVHTGTSKFAYFIAEVDDKMIAMTKIVSLETHRTYCFQIVFSSLSLRRIDLRYFIFRLFQLFFFLI